MGQLLEHCLRRPFTGAPPVMAPPAGCVGCGCNIFLHSRYVVKSFYLLILYFIGCFVSFRTCHLVSTFVLSSFRLPFRFLPLFRQSSNFFHFLPSFIFSFFFMILIFVLSFSFHVFFLPFCSPYYPCPPILSIFFFYPSILSLLSLHSCFTVTVLFVMSMSAH